MKQLTAELIKNIENHIEAHKVNLIRLEGFDDPVLYYDICRSFTQRQEIQLISKLTIEKYRRFCSDQKFAGNAALTGLRQGTNLFDSVNMEPSFKLNSFVDFDGAITRWRNEAANCDEGETVLVLLMGTELAPDKGGLEDFFVLSPAGMIREIKKDYAKWFHSIIAKNGINEDGRRALDTLYSTLFSYINIDLVKLSAFVDSLDSETFSTAQELINHICETLNSTWGIPSVIASVPKVSALKNGKKSSASIIAKSAKFICRVDDILTVAAEKKLRAKFDAYADKKGVDPSDMFPYNNPVFNSYIDFRECVIAFLNGKDIEKNRNELLKVDFSIVNDIVDVKLGGRSSTSIPTYKDEPVPAFSKMILDSAFEFINKHSQMPNKFSFCINRITLSNCTDDTSSESYKSIWSYVGGLLQYLTDASIVIGEDPVVFEYDTTFHHDPFSNTEAIDEIPVKVSGKWGDPCKFEISIKVSNEQNDIDFKCKWVFSPFSAWACAFSYLCDVVDREEDFWLLPSLVSCGNMQDYISCESEDEFYNQLLQIKDIILYDEHVREVKRYFGNNLSFAKHRLLLDSFKDFSIVLTQRGLFNALNELRSTVSKYRDLMKTLSEEMPSFTDVQKDKTPLLLNSFVIVDNHQFVDDCMFTHALVPAYNPIILEKIDAKNVFIRQGFVDALRSVASLLNNSSRQHDYRCIIQKFDRIVGLACITQGPDVLSNRKREIIPCISSWEYWMVYQNEKLSVESISNGSYGSAVIIDDDDNTVIVNPTHQSNIVTRNVLDYIKTFPARTDGLNIAFIAPSDLQHIVAAINAIDKEMDKKGIDVVLNVTVVCINSNKSSASYLKMWLDSYFNEEKTVKVRTYLRQLTIKREADVTPIRNLINNMDLCFIYNVLEGNGIKYTVTVDTQSEKDIAKFPMALIPDTISSTHGKTRKLCVSQFQFVAERDNTQATYRYLYPDSKKATYQAFKELELKGHNNKIIEIAHECCRWVVCVDAAMDRYMLENGKNKVIGFTTGEGSYGELNVTVSARNDILADIQKLLATRLKEKFNTWSIDRITKAAEFCISATKHLDGSRILKALNPYDYEIHNYLAYVLTTQMIEAGQLPDGTLLQSLISLDSYHHWFLDDEDNSRPDFMLISIPNSTENLQPNTPLHLQIKIIECKMGYKNENHIEKAKAQIEKGLKTMCENWDPSNNSGMCHYWQNQLYRAIIFSKIQLGDNTAEYEMLRNKIYGILSGKYEIEWSGDIFAFWLNANDDEHNVWPFDLDAVDKLRQQGVSIGDLKCHSCGQLFIQRMLCPETERNSGFEYIEQQLGDEDDICDIEPEYEKEDEEMEGLTIPGEAEVRMPFLGFLNDDEAHTRQESLKWFSAKFSISSQDKEIVYESNGHKKWETVLDFIISDFRRDGLLSNTSTGCFAITSFGKAVYQMMTSHPELSINDAILKLKEENATKEVDKVNDNAEESNPGIPEVNTDTSNESANNKRIPLNEVRLFLGKDTKTNECYYWEFGNKSLNNRHLLINGNSGCGKTYCIQGLLMDAATQGVSAVVFDYTGGFTNSQLDPLFKQTLGDRIKQRIIRVSKIPVNPFKKHDIQIDEDFFVPENDVDVASKIAEIFTSVYKFGEQQKSAIYSAVLKGIRQYGEQMSFPKMAELLSEVGTTNAKSVLSKIQAFTDIDPFTLDETLDWGDIRDSSGQVYVIQLVGYSRDIQILLTELLLWDIWSYCVKNGDESKPFILVLDEAQNLSHGEKSPSAKILTEGRKFGLSGWYATQFMKPQLSDDEIQRLQQAGQKLYFCPPDDGVMTVARNIDIGTQGTKEWAEKLKKLKKGECVTCGNMVRSGRWLRYDPRIIKVISLQERIESYEEK